MMDMLRKLVGTSTGLRWEHFDPKVGAAAVGCV
jgi:hypothetical protein